MLTGCGAHIFTAPLIAEQPPAAAVAATRDLITHARLRLGPDGDHLAGDLLVSLTLATARHLEDFPEPAC